MNEKIHYLTLPDNLIVYRLPRSTKLAFIRVADEVLAVCDNGRLLKAMPVEVADLIKVTVTDRHLNVINGDIRSCSKLSDESLEYLKSLTNKKNKGEI